MPSPAPSRNISLRDFDKGGTWKPRRKTASGHPPRAKQLVELLTLGPADGRPAMTLPEAAAHMGVKIGTARAYLHLPASRQLFLQLCTAIREGEIPANLRVAVEIRDDPNLKSAAGARAKIEAARYIERGGDKAQGVTVNLGMQIGVNGGNIAPGYLVGIPEEYASAGRRLLQKARSTRDVLDRDGAVEGTIIDEAVPEASVASETLSVDSVEPAEAAFGRPRYEQFAPRDSRRRAPLVPIDDAVHD